jgi:hypothetical protein
LRGRAGRLATIGLSLSERRMGEMARRQRGCAGRLGTLGLSSSDWRSVALARRLREVGVCGKANRPVYYCLGGAMSQPAGQCDLRTRRASRR